jgi:hypothetical protein
MYIFTLVIPIRQVVENLGSDRGPFKLAMLYNTDLGASRGWNLIVASEWMDRLGFAESTKLVAAALHQELPEQDRPAISRVTVLKTSDPFVRDMTQLYPVPAGPGIPLKQVTAGDVREGAGFVFCSQPQVPA